MQNSQQPNNPTEDHLRLLSIFHYIVGGLAVLFGCFPLGHVAIGMAMLTGVIPAQSSEDEAIMGIMGSVFAFIGAVVILMMWALGICTVLAGKYLRQRRNRTFCFVVAGILTVFFPFGTVLGVFTLVVLLKPEVKDLFEGTSGTEPHLPQNS